MMRSLLIAFAGTSVLALVPSSASAQSLPSKVELETCWYGVCSGVYSRYHFVPTQPILSPDTGEIWNSQGFAGFYSFNPFDSSLQLTTVNFPVGIYQGSFIDGCLSGTTVQAYYGGYGDFFWEGCP